MKKHKMFDTALAMRSTLPFLVGYVLSAGYLMWVHQIMFALLVSVISASFMLYQLWFAWKWIVVHPEGIEIYASRQKSYVPWEMITSVMNSASGMLLNLGAYGELVTLEVPYYISDYNELRQTLAQACSSRGILFR